MGKKHPKGAPSRHHGVVEGEIKGAKQKRPEMSTSGRGKRTNPCGKCGEECKGGGSVPCGFCEVWWHTDCVEGMSPAFIECCDKMNRLNGGSAYLCFSCRKLASKLNNQTRNLETKVDLIMDQLRTSELERMVLAEKIEKLEGKSDTVRAKVTGMEDQIEAGMEKVINVVTETITVEKKELEERAENIVIYGLPESDKEKSDDRKKEEKEQVEEMATAMGVTVDKMEIKWRAGKKKENETNMRPLIVKVEDDEIRGRLLKNARLLVRTKKWEKVFVNPDMTFKQRQEFRKEETKLKAEAERKNEEQKNEGEEEEEGKWVVVGGRGRRKVAWKKEEDRRR